MTIRRSIQSRMGCAALFGLAVIAGCLDSSRLDGGPPAARELGTRALAGIGPGGEECPLCPTVIAQWASGDAVSAACVPTCIRCGDGTCDEHENEVTCPTDCPILEPWPVCGNGLCEEETETWRSCPSDCPTPADACGDGLCEGNERWVCPQDCI